MHGRVRPGESERERNAIKYDVESFLKLLLTKAGILLSTPMQKQKEKKSFFSYFACMLFSVCRFPGQRRIHMYVVVRVDAYVFM